MRRKRTKLVPDACILVYETQNRKLYARNIRDVIENNLLNFKINFPLQVFKELIVNKMSTIAPETCVKMEVNALMA